MDPPDYWGAKKHKETISAGKKLGILNMDSETQFLLKVMTNTTRVENVEAKNKKGVLLVPGEQLKVSRLTLVHSNCKQDGHLTLWVSGTGQAGPKSVSLRLC